MKTGVYPVNSPITRRRFLTLGVIASGGALLNSSQVTGAGIRSGRSVIYASDFIPDGASLKIAFVADHHYWPHHFKNWGEKLFRDTEERMRDLVAALNDERPDFSIHCGDVIDAGNSFVPPTDEYIRQLDFEKRFLDALRHPAIPMIGNHEVPDDRYESESELDQWKRRFGPPYRFVDTAGWRLVTLNCMVPNPGGTLAREQAYGIDDGQVRWLDGVLREASAKSLSALLFCHIPPAQFNYHNDFERVVESAGCVRAVFCGHNHANSRAMLGGIPVLVRTGNAMAPLGYTIINAWPDGRLVVVQKSQHLPFLNYLSDILRPGLQGKEQDRYITIGGSSELPCAGLRVIGEGARAVIRDGHLKLTSEKGRGFVLIDTPELDNVRIRFSAVKDGASHMGVVACADRTCSRRIEGVVTSAYGPDGNLYLSSCDGPAAGTLARSWFNIADGIAYGFVLEARKGRITLKMKNMPEISASAGGKTGGLFGMFVEGGSMMVTDLALERM